MKRYNTEIWKYHKYNTSKYNFRELINEMLETTDLENLHKSVESNEMFSLKTEQSTVYHKLFYDKVRGSKFLEVYEDFVKEILKPILGEDKIIYQKIPTFRTHFVDNIAVGKWHRDADYFHHTTERNIFMPITDSFGTNTFWAESQVGKEDFKPVNAEYGEYVIWDGANLLHGNKPNTENYTRVSFDFRIMKYSDYDAEERASQQTMHAHVPMIIGEYYEVM